MVRAIIALALFAGCVEEDYRCAKDTDCNLGADGACEVDKRCTIRSATCDTGREYAPLQGTISGTCYDERRDPLNPCAEGQPPARGESTCMAAVCDAMPACCRSGWTSACVQQAQLRCEELVCDTRIAITAVRGMTTELWTATYTPFTTPPWSLPERYEPASSLSWFAPRRDETEPRLGVFSQGSFEPPINATLTIGSDVYELDARSYFQAQSIDFSRDAHDVLLLASSGGGKAIYETFDLDTRERHAFEKQYTVRTVVGEINRDGFPDIASCNNGGGYAAVLNEDPVAGTDFRILGTSSGDVINGQPTPTMNIEGRSIEFSDADNNRALDMIVAGRQVRLHMPPGEGDVLNASSLTVSIDCDPPQSPAGSCPGAEQAAVSWVATARPGIAKTTVIAAPWPGRVIYELEVDRTGILSQSFVPMGGCGAVCDKKWVAVATRDLDGDHIMDLIAVDENINIYTSRSSTGGALDLTLMIDQPRESITNVRITVTGAPINP